MNIQVSPSQTFRYSAPAAARRASRILVKPNLGYPRPHPVTVSVSVLAEILRALREANPGAEILVLEGVCSKEPLDEIAARRGVPALLDDGMRLLDADALPLTEYPNLAEAPTRFKTMLAPSLLREVDCRISVGTFKRTELNGSSLISASLKNLYGLFPRARYKGRSPKSRGQLHRPSVPGVLHDIYHCVGHLFEAGVVDGTERYVSPDWKPDRARAAVPFGKIIWGDDLLAVDARACTEAGEAVPDYIQSLQRPLEP